jgi:hypothetical protein
MLATSPGAVAKEGTDQMSWLRTSLLDAALSVDQPLRRRIEALRSKQGELFEASAPTAAELEREAMRRQDRRRYRLRRVA